MSYRLSWVGLVMVGLVLLGLYFSLRLVQRLLSGAIASEWALWADQKLLRPLLFLYEPLATLIWCTLFVFINPPIHALLLALLGLGVFPHLRNYFSGRVVRLGHPISAGRKLRSGGIQGVAARLGNLGLYLQADDGLHYLSYSRLLSEGYTLLSGEDVSTVYHLSVRSDDDTPPDKAAGHLMDLLATAPYLDWNHKPEYLPAGTDSSVLQVRVVLKKKSHLYDLVQLLKEWGFSCTIID